MPTYSLQWFCVPQVFYGLRSTIKLNIIATGTYFRYAKLARILRCLECAKTAAKENIGHLYGTKHVNALYDHFNFASKSMASALYSILVVTLWPCDLLALIVLLLPSFLFLPASLRSRSPKWKLNRIWKHNVVGARTMFWGILWLPSSSPWINVQILLLDVSVALWLHCLSLPFAIKQNAARFFSFGIGVQYV